MPAGITIATKLDRDPDTGSFSAERMRASLQESRERLGLDVIPLLYLHDPERISYREAFADDGPVRALVAMKEAGEAVSIGISGGPAPMLQHYVETDLFDAVITHNRYTLVDRSAAELIDVAVDRGVAVVNAAVYGGGALARWPEPVTSYAYQPAHPTWFEPSPPWASSVSATGCHSRQPPCSSRPVTRGSPRPWWGRTPLHMSSSSSPTTRSRSTPRSSTASRH